MRTAIDARATDRAGLHLSPSLLSMAAQVLGRGR